MTQQPITSTLLTNLRPIKSTLQLEGVAIALASGVIYAQNGGGWVQFILLFLVPDIFMLGYLAGPRIGAALYNAGHSYLGPLILAGVGSLANAQMPLLIALIWGAHIGIDRAIGYGLKYGSGFKDTHLGRV